MEALVPRTGIEPAHPCEYKILSLARLPIPPSGLLFSLNVRISPFLELCYLGKNEA